MLPHISPVMSRLNPLTGEVTNPTTSLHARLNPYFESSNTNKDIRLVTSHNAIPLMVVAIKSLMAGGSISAKNSQVKLPANE